MMFSCVESSPPFPCIDSGVLTYRQYDEMPSGCKSLGYSLGYEWLLSNSLAFFRGRCTGDMFLPKTQKIRVKI